MSVSEAFPPSVVGVPTAVPAFVGYTLNAAPMQAIEIASLAAYEQTFGATSPGALHDSIALYFANGGGTCFVVSVGTAAPITANALINGLNVVRDHLGVTIVVAPDASLLASIDAFATVAQTMLAQAGTLQDRMAILDVWGGASVTPDTLADVSASFRNAIGNQFLSYGAAYFPYLVEMDKTILPASGVMAGIWCASDAANGVWNAPANIAIEGIASVAYKLSVDDQESLMLPPDGKAINALRNFPGRGDVVWGARTFDGNSNDYRYIQVRRTLIYIEQSIKAALQPFVFAPNDANAWASAVSLISNFLNGLWLEGALMGSTAKDAYSVQCGIGSTMTSQDILNGYMIVQVLLAMVRPAEFLVLTFQQQMATAD